MKIKTVCVLGGTGFLGNFIVSKLDAAGYQVKVLSRARERAKHLILLPNVDVKTCDFNSGRDLVEGIKGCDAVINLIGILHESDNHMFEAVHHQMPRRIAQICNDQGIDRFLHVSALGADKSAPSQYLQSKAKGEAAIDEYSKKLNITIFRPSVIFGRGDRFLTLFASLIKFLPVLLLAKPNAKFQPIWVEDVASAVVNSLENITTYGNTYDLGGPSVYSLKELVQKVMQTLGKKRPIIGLNDRSSYMQASFMECLPVKLMTRDNVRSMEVDNVASSTIAPELGVVPTPLEAVITEYLVNETPRSIYDKFRSAAGRAIHVYK